MTAKADESRFIEAKYMSRSGRDDIKQGVGS